MDYNKVHERSLKALPYLIRAAQSHKTVTYKEIGQVMGVHHRQVRYYAGHVRDEICTPDGSPLLNCLIVNKKTKMPGESYLPFASKATTDEEARLEFENFRDEVFQFDGWNELLKKYDLSPLIRSNKELEEEALAYNDFMNRHPGLGESTAHKQLKNYIAENPMVLRLPESTISHIEYRFLSGDSVDVAFQWGDHEWAVIEVKRGINIGELIRGIYQAIKYRALAKAQHGKKVKAFLVAFDIPDEIIKYARRHNVNVIQIKRAVI